MSTLDNRLNWRNKNSVAAGESTVSRLATRLDASATVVALSSYYDGVTPLDKSGDSYSEAGYGTCIVIHDYPATSDGKNHTCLVFDLGNDSSSASSVANNGTTYNGCGSTLMRYLNDNSITTIDALFISHYHGDHFQMNALSNLHSHGFTITEIVLPHAGILSSNSVDRFTKKSGRGAELRIYENNADDIPGTLRGHGMATVIRKPAKEDESYDYGEGAAFKVACYNVTAAKFESGDYYNWCYNENYNVRHQDETNPSCNYNNFSMINVVTVAGKKIVITGDIMAPAVKANLDIISSSDIIFVPHHGLDCFTAPEALNHLSAKYAVINSAYDGINLAEGDNPTMTGEDGPGHLTRMSRSFAAELLKHGCIVASTYAGYTAEEYSSTYNKKLVKFRVSIDNVVLEETPSYAGNGLLPQAIQPYSETIPLKDDKITPKYTSYEGTPQNSQKFTSADAFVRSLPFGEYITLFDSHATAFKDALPFKYEGRKFKLIVEPASFRGKGKTQIAYHIGTSASPEILMRTENTEKSIGPDEDTQVEDSWTAWRSFRATDAVVLAVDKVDAAKLTPTGVLVRGGTEAISEDTLDKWLVARYKIIASNDPDEFLFKVSDIGDLTDANVQAQSKGSASLNWTWTATMTKTGGGWGTLTAHCGFSCGTTIQKRCLPKYETEQWTPVTDDDNKVVYYEDKTKDRKEVDEAETPVWQPFEFVNPPMFNNIEFRTCERYFGSPVYTKLFEINEGTSGLSADGLAFTTTLPNGALALKIEARMNGVPVTSITSDSDGKVTVAFPSNAVATGVDSFVQLWYYKPGTV